MWDTINHDLDHANFFNEAVYEDHGIPSDDNINNAAPHVDGRNSPLNGSPTIDHSENDLGHFHGSNGSALEDEMPATHENETELDPINDYEAANSEDPFVVETEKPLIGFDMGGTSTDVSRYAGSYEQVLETQIVGAIIQAPQLDIRTIATGSGSKLKFQFGTFRVGPESVGAHPGTDVNRYAGSYSPICREFEVHTGSGAALAKLNGCAATSWMGCYCDRTMANFETGRHEEHQQDFSKYDYT
ncbi:5-oxoprolinase-like protein [Artemisia annua]|uniref:5-oxoprolinase-like protein n=1 Tax=Artemisia annua TaxID=35608 RepID=A0A2U1L2B0_ARTAN|nr:5-oxoprolinase-like protein [Artemisia annua]